MEEHVLGVTRFVNHILGPAATVLLSRLHIQPASPETPIPQHVVMAMIAVLIGTVFTLVVRSRLSVEKPGALQQVAEMLLTNPLEFGIRDLLVENVGRQGVRYLPFVGAISIFILISNLMAVFPFFVAPTGTVTVPLACATLTFLYFNWQGIRHHGNIAYLKHFAGPVPLLSPLIFPVEIISTCARVLSLTVRLWANIFASDLLYSIFLSLLLAPVLWGWNKTPVLGIVLAVFPALIPLAFIGLHIFVAIIQTYIFTVLPSVYLGIATGEEH